MLLSLRRLQSQEDDCQPRCSNDSPGHCVGPSFHRRQSESLEPFSSKQHQRDHAENGHNTKENSGEGGEPPFSAGRRDHKEWDEWLTGSKHKDNKKGPEGCTLLLVICMLVLKMTVMMKVCVSPMIMEFNALSSPQGFSNTPQRVGQSKTNK